MNKAEWELIDELKENHEKWQERRIEAVQERNLYIDKLCSMSNDRLGDALKAYLHYLKEGKLAKIHSQEVALAHDLIAEIILLDKWEC